MFEKLKQKSAAFDKSPLAIEERKTEVDQLETKKKVDQVKDIKQLYIHFIPLITPNETYTKNNLKLHI